MKFEKIYDASDCGARAGLIHTDHGTIETPIFMPVGTVGSVKGINQDQLRDTIEAQIILGNTYHLYLRPGLEVIEGAGGLHKFIDWDRPLLTDSGGYQVYSLSDRRKITEEGVTFSSHIDGSKHFFTPERAIDIQRSIGADIIMAFDECTPYPCTHKYAKNSLGLTHRWLARCMTHFEQGTSKYGYEQTLAPIVQGSVYLDLRKESAEVIAQYDATINAIGGLSVGEPAPLLYEMTDAVCTRLPKDKARYLMGVGTPANLLECIALGIDMFDCVLPTRNARHGLIYTSEGLLNIKNRKWATCHEPIDINSASPFSRNHTKSYLRHLMISKERLGGQIASIQNLTFYRTLMQTARIKIMEGNFMAWKRSMMDIVTNRL